MRHEAVEALANLCPKQHLDVFKKYMNSNVNDDLRIFADTCELALSKTLSWDELHSLYGLLYNGTREPAPPFSKEDLQNILGNEDFSKEDLFAFISNPNTPLFDKYRAFYYIRNSKNAELITEMTKALRDSELGALIKHEISFILG